MAPTDDTTPTAASAPVDFIRTIIDEDLRAGKNHGRLATRFPPEPNGYLHIGHAKSICLNFGLAEDYPGGRCHLRFDDTNPCKEELEYVEAIQRDVKWLGFDWHGPVRFASDYFEQLYGYAEELVGKGLAYVDSLSSEEMRSHRGTLTEPGRDSPDRSRSIEENLDLLRRMRAGEFADGERVLRAKIDMASPNINLRDPVIYRVRHASHHQTGDAWCIYPMYDYTHCISDALEGITHSLCTLEFEDHRPLYDWFLDHLSVPCHPQQIEFSRLDLQYTLTSKRKLQQLVEEGKVSGWDDPRLPTIAGLRRRGYTPAAIRDFCRRIGVTKADNSVEMELLESCIRDDLDHNAPRRMAVLDPLKLVIENYPDQIEWLQVPNHPQHEALGSRKLPFGREIYIDRADFRETAGKEFKRLVSGGEVRLRHGYVIRCDQVLRDDSGEIRELRCSHDPQTLGKAPEGRKVKGVIHWVEASHAIAAELRLYQRLFVDANPAAADNFLDSLNPDSLTIVQGFVEPELATAQVGQGYQFEREGYFCLDPDSQPQRLIFNRTVALKDSFARIDQPAGR
ncbi:MAG TPA: glutamine--tRNA ligase/YqeY domain fusion protein [Pseudomonadales bacterium]|nr:glutamine--tRNA ligase/YqeY domain fusion protein [Pseudomonadales bacterium]